MKEPITEPNKHITNRSLSINKLQLHFTHILSPFFFGSYSTINRNIWSSILFPNIFVNLLIENMKFISFPDHFEFWNKQQKMLFSLSRHIVSNDINRALKNTASRGSHNAWLDMPEYSPIGRIMELEKGKMTPAE